MTKQPKPDKLRLDLLLVELSLCETRQLAQGLIRTRQVLVNQQIVDQPSTPTQKTAIIEIKQPPLYVSRGGYKLQAALTYFNIKVGDRYCLDAGISTGGFTDCLLQNGAKLVYGVDVGYGQVDWKIRTDPRVILKERTNIRYSTPTELYQDQPIPNLAVVDLSFISLTKILPTLWLLLESPKEVVLLIKPQFEVGKEKIAKKGLVKDPNSQAQAIYNVFQAALSSGWNIGGLTVSPIVGAKSGNIEYLLWLHENSSESQWDDLPKIQNFTAAQIK